MLIKRWTYLFILNILSNFVPHEFLLYDDKDSPWFNKKVRAFVQEKNVAYKTYRDNSGNIALKCRLKYLQNCLNAFIEVAKEKYHKRINKLINTQKNFKVYWSLLKIFLNNKKIPIIPPLFHENRFITDFTEKKNNFLIFTLPNNAPLFLIIALFLLMLTILLTNVYLQVHFQPEILEKSFKILIQTKSMDMIS